MATATADAKGAKKVSKVKRGDWSGTADDKLQSRKVDTTQRNGAALTYTEYKLNKVSDPTEAMTLLKLAKASAVKALTLGANRLSRNKAAKSSGLVASLAEHMGITHDEARAIIEAKKK